MTRGEYESAVEAARQCVQDAGVEVSEPYDAMGGTLLTFSYETPSDPDALADVRATYDRCYAKHQEEADAVWFNQSIPTGAERTKRFSQLVSCLESVGVTGVTEDLILEDVARNITEQVDGDDDAMSAALWCVDDHRVLYPEGMFGN
jgi:hypothetical protein